MLSSGERRVHSGFPIVPLETSADLPYMESCASDIAWYDVSM